MNKGVPNTEACQRAGINRRTGNRWRNGRTVVTSAGSVIVYPPIVAPRAERGHFLTRGERELIADGVLVGDTVRAIAVRLGRSPSTISREIQRNRDELGRYLPFGAHRKALGRRSRTRPGKLTTNIELRAAVQGRLDVRWSPKQIAEHLGIDHPDDPDMRVSHETIYQALYAKKGADLHRSPARVLRTGRLRRKPRRRADRRTTRFVEPMVMISDRPADVADRAVAGHWEGDLLMGEKNRSAIATLVERTTRFTLLVHLRGGHTAEEVSSAVIEAIAPLPPDLRRSLTWDQGCEMSCHADVTAVTGTPIFFCEPGSPWQRPTNENTNGLLRQYFPKGTNLRVHDADRLEEVAAELNNRPREVLGWKTPTELIEQLKATHTNRSALR
jgi:IS30 family transposase